MPIHIEELTADVTAQTGELPLSEAQLRQIASYVMHCIQQRQRDDCYNREATKIRPTAQPTGPVQSEHG